MRSLVHGPVDLVVADSGDQPPDVGVGMATWVDGWGLAVMGSGFEVDLVQLTGRVVRVGSAWPGWSGIGWSHDDHPCLTDRFSSRWRRVSFPACGDREAGVVLPPRLNVAMLADRVLWFTGTDVRAHLLSSPSIDAVECTVLAGAGSGMIFPADLQAGRWWVVNLQTAELALYDAVAKDEVAGFRTSLGAGPLTGAAYSRALDLFFATRYVGGVHQLSVYANEPVAASISAPAFTPSAPRAGSLRTVRSRVLGDLSEPCGGRVVTFSATVGSFDRAAVETGPDGWAETIYRAPAGPSTGASVTATLVE